MKTYDLLYIGLIVLSTLMIFRSVKRILVYSAEDKANWKNQDGKRFFFFSYYWTTKVLTNLLIFWALYQQPYEKGGIYIAILAILFACYSTILVIKWPTEVMTISAEALEFRIGNSRKLDQIKGVTFEENRLIIHARDYPKKTRLLKRGHRGDWNSLRTAVYQFVSQNPSIGIKGTPPGKAS
ncbi:MAG: hypothetical protein Roseis2KO_45200 [Roseivirga sp.]